MDTPKDRAHEKLVTVYTASNSIEARMVQEVLANAGIESMLRGVIGEAVSGIYAVMTGPWASQDILVLDSAADVASRILAELPEPNQIDFETEG